MALATATAILQLSAALIWIAVLTYDFVQLVDVVEEDLVVRHLVPSPLSQNVTSSRK